MTDDSAPLGEGEIRSLAVEIVDAIYGHTLEFSNAPIAHEHDYDYTERLITGALRTMRHVGWMGPYGIIPGGLDVEPAPHWLPLYLVVDTAETGRTRP